MSILDDIYNKAQGIKPSAQQWMAKGPETEWTKPVDSPASDPFAPKPWRGVKLPEPIPVKPGAWLSTLYTDLTNRLKQGYELADKPDLTEEQAAKYLSRLEQLAWQIHLIELVAKECIPCPPQICACRVGGGPSWLSMDHRDRYVYDMQQAHQAGQMAIKITTPGGLGYNLVPWKSDPPKPDELDPLDMAALARVAALTGLTELEVLDQVQKG